MRTALLAKLFAIPLLALLAAPAAAGAQFTHDSGSPYTTGESPFAAAIADFDGDGRADVATVNEGSDDVTVLLRQAGGGYAPEAGSPIAAGDHPTSVATADFNGDGRPDLAVSNFGSGDVTILLRSPGGGFVPEGGSPIATGAQASSVAVADFNADGRPDLAVTNQNGLNVTILLRDAGGGFTEEPGSPVDVGTYPHEVAVADFDGVNGPDLAVTNQSSNDVTVLLRQPGGGFAEEAGSPIGVGTTPLGIAAADFDADGDADLAVANSGSDSISVLRRSPGGFTADAPRAVGERPYGLATADFDGDGHPDLAVANGDRVDVLRGSDFGTASTAVDLGGPLRIAAGDLDGDGRVDLVAPGHAANQLTALISAPDTTPPDTTITAGPTGLVSAAPAYAFEADEAGAHFECRVSPAGWAPCTSPSTAGVTAAGVYQFEVRAIDAAGNADPTPAMRAFTFVPALQKPQNVQRPTIKAGALRNRYMCDGAQWENLGPNPSYTYRWYRKQAFQASAPVGTDYLYTLPDAYVGSTHYCVVTATNAAGSATAYSFNATLWGGNDNAYTIAGAVYGNVAVRGIDLFQTVQPSSGAQMFGFPSGGFPALGGGGTPTNLFANGIWGGPRQRVAYSGVPLDAEKPTTAVVYVNMTAAAATNANTPLEVTLHWRRNGQRFGSITKEIKNPRVSALPAVSAAERDDARFGVQFQVPMFPLTIASLGARLDFEAEVNFTKGDLALGRLQCATGTACDADDRFRLDDIPAAKLPALTVVAVKLRGRGQQDHDIADGYSVMEKARQLYPGGEGMIVGTVASLDVGDETSYTLSDDQCDDIDAPDTRTCRMRYVTARLESWRADDPVAKGLGPYQSTLGVHDYRTDGPTSFIEPGWTKKGVTLADWNPKHGASPLFTANDGSADRPLTAAGHEFGHVLSAPHASTSCSGNDNGQTGEEWLPDNMGRLQGVKFDRTAVPPQPDPPAPPVDPIVDPVVDTPANQLIDLMSYCAAEGKTPTGVYSTNAWLSARNWNRTFQVLQNLGEKMNAPAAAAAGAQAAQGFAAGVVGASGGRILRYVAPDGNDRIPAAEPGSPVRLRALDARGRVLQEVGVRVSGSSESDTEGGAFVGPVPAAAAAVELVRDGTVVDRLRRSAAPTVRLLSARPGLVRWTASDPDGDALHAGVEYSPDGGRTWRTVSDGPSTGSATLPARLLAGSNDARLRVTVSDGFTEARAESKRLRVGGSRPIVRIVPVRGAHAGEPTLLTGRALDDRQRPLRGRALTWYAGTRRLGRGERLSARLPTGRTTLRLVAVDARGNRSVARTTVRVVAR